MMATDFSCECRRRPARRRFSISLPFLLTALVCCSDQRGGAGEQAASTVEPLRTVDRSFRPTLPEGAYETGAGPVVCVDETHNNFHSAVGTYLPFAELLRRDGYVVERSIETLDLELLSHCRVLVIADAQPPARRGDPPTFPTDEVALFRDWVNGGGSLFVITDHMPDPAPIAQLAAAFGIEVNNGYVLNGGAGGTERPIVYRRSEGSLLQHPVTDGRNAGEEVNVVATFTGSAFRSGDQISPLLVLGSGRQSWMPEDYWEFEPDTPRLDVSGWYQGAVAEHGEGRLAFFGEAAMFTAQVFNRGNVRAGMNSPLAEDNAQLLLNVVHWLTGIL